MTINSVNTPTRTVEVDGVPFAYRELGPQGGIPIIFLHHFTAVIDDWDPRILDGFATKYRVVVFDNKGIGGTGGNTPHTIEEMAKDAVAFIRALGLHKVHLLGFSMGGFVAQVIAMTEPELVDRLILTGTGPSGIGGEAGKLPQLVQKVSAKAAELKKHVKHFLFFSQTPASQAAADAFLARLQERREDRVPPLSQEAMLAHIAAIQSWGQVDPSGLSKVKNQTFIANGDNDIMVATERSFQLHKLIQNSRLSIYPNSGHGGIFQYHDLFVQQALEFLSEPAASV